MYDIELVISMTSMILQKEKNYNECSFPTAVMEFLRFQVKHGFCVLLLSCLYLYRTLFQLSKLGEYEVVHLVV